MTCETCKFWGRYYEGACDRVGDLHTERDQSRRFELKLYADDDQGLEGLLMTGPKFGCIQWQERKGSE